MVWKFVLWFIISHTVTSESLNDGDQPTSVDKNHEHKEQSPVDIIVEKTKMMQVPRLEYINMDAFIEREVIITNNGSTVRVTFTEDTSDLPEITGGPLSDVYKFEQMHFHWGDTDAGSEHTINHKRYAMEIHLVYYDTNFGTYDKAIDSNIGLCVLSFLGQISETHNHSLDTFIDDLEHLITPGLEIKRNFHAEFPWINNLFPQQYYTYHGSLTTPQYNECVKWIISTTSFDISSSQLEKFRELHKLENKEEKCISKNFRQSQDLEGRTVFYVKNSENNEIELY